MHVLYGTFSIVAVAANQVLDGPACPGAGALCDEQLGHRQLLLPN